MKTILIVLLVLTMLGTLGVLFAGMVGMVRTEANPQRSNALMRWRVLLQAAALVLFGSDALLGLLTNAVQTLAGVLLPSATVFLLLLCNDRAVLGPWVNGRWTNLFTGAVIAILVLLSVVLTASVLYPDITGETILAILGGGGATARCADTGCDAETLRHRGQHALPQCIGRKRSRLGLAPSSPRRFFLSASYSW